MDNFTRAPIPFRREGGLAAFLAGILLPAGHVFNLNGHPDFGTVAGASLVLTAHVLLVFALFGLQAAQSARSGLLGWLSADLSVIGTVLVSAVVFVEIAGAAGVDVSGVFATPFSRAFSMLGAFAFFIGLILFGISVMLARIFPSWAGLLLIVGTIGFGFGGFVGSAEPVFSVGGALLTGAGFVLAGWGLLSPASAP